MSRLSRIGLLAYLLCGAHMTGIVRLCYSPEPVECGKLPYSLYIWGHLQQMELQHYDSSLDNPQSTKQHYAASVL